MSATKRNKLSIPNKYEIIVKVKNGMKRSDVMKEYGLKPLSHLTRILAKKYEIIQKFNQMNKKDVKKSFKLSTSKYPKEEKAVIKWMRQMRHKKGILSSNIILKKAEDFAKLFGNNDWTPTAGFLKGLKRRHNVLFTKKHGESDSVSEQIVQKWSQELKTIINGYKPEDVYNLDESALFWRLLPSKTYAFTDESKYGIKKSKERITIVVITNADGSDRMCTMIGKSVRPLAFRGIKYFPIDYYSQ